MSVASSATASRTGGVLAATCLSTLVVNANTSAVSILLPAISEDTGTSVDTLQWAVTGYSLMGAAVIVTSGALGDVFGRKKVFQLGLLLFVASCVLIALSTTGAGVIGGRIIQGAAGSTILACGLSLLSVANTGQEQLRAVSLWGAAAAVGAAAGFAFVAVERRVAVPMLDLALLRNRVLVGATIAILIGAGTINGLMYLLSLYFQDPATLGFTPLQAGIATLPATAGLVAVAPLVPKLAARFGGRQVIALGFLLTAVGFGVIGVVQSDWKYSAFVLPLIAIAVGMGLSNGPASSASTACVSANQV